MTLLTFSDSCFRCLLRFLFLFTSYDFLRLFPLLFLLPVHLFHLPLFKNVRPRLGKLPSSSYKCFEALMRWFSVISAYAMVPF